MISKQAGTLTLVAVTVACMAACLLSPRIPQPQSYHNFADHRARFGIANFNDVVSNLPIAIVGIWGWTVLARKSSRTQFIQYRERWPYFLMFLELLWTAFGSAYYHLAPDNARLVWDRLPMTIVFMPLVAAMIMERLDVAGVLMGLASPALSSGASANFAEPATSVFMRRCSYTLSLPFSRCCLYLLVIPATRISPGCCFAMCWQKYSKPPTAPFPTGWWLRQWSHLEALGRGHRGIPDSVDAGNTPAFP